MRALVRSIVHHKMKKAGFTQVNKVKSSDGSYFARHWRDYLKEV